MPSEKTRNTMLRQWELLKLIPSKPPGKTARELTEGLMEHGFQVSKRTVERDLVELSGIFGLVCNDAGIPYGWHWMPGAFVDMPAITLAEAMSLRVIEEYVKPLLPMSVLKAIEPKFNQAKIRLDALAEENKIAQWGNKVRSVTPSMPLKPPEIDQVILETVHEALLRDLRIEVDYRSHRATTSNFLSLNPLGLIQRGPITYLAATAFDYEDVRLYAVHRILHAEMTHSPARRIEEFNMDDYIASGSLHFGDGTTIGLKAVVSDGLAEYLRETPLSEDMNLKKVKGEFRLKATVQDTWQLRWWILSQADRIVVLKPIHIRNSVRADLKKALTEYNKQY